jgi:hypothetical protein
VKRSISIVTRLLYAVLIGVAGLFVSMAGESYRQPDPKSLMEQKTFSVLSRLVAVKLILLVMVTVSFSFLFNQTLLAQGNIITVCASGCDYTTIQNAVNNANPGDTIQLAAETFTSAVVNKNQLTLQGAGIGQTILQGSSCSTSTGGIALSANISGTTIADLTITGFQDGIQLFTGPITNTLIEDVAAVSNCRHGIYVSMSSGFSGLTLRRVNASNNNITSYGRGVWVINGIKEKITIEDSVFNHNGLVGIDISDGNVTDLLIRNNQVISNGDSGIGVLGPTGPGETLVISNTVVDNGRFGIEIKNPTGSGNSSGPGSVVVANNTISRTVTATGTRDYAGIAVFRRSPGVLNADQPSGVVITGNRVSGYLVTQTVGVTGEGFGIVLEGQNHTAAGNILTNNDIGLQLQAANPSPNITDTYTFYFDRGNAASTPNVLVVNNTIYQNLYGVRSIGPVTGGITANLVYTNTQNGLTILDEASTGILVNNNQFCDNASFGVENKSLTSTVDALNNWWGALDGPGPVGPGSGDRVSSRVNFSPFDTSNPDGPCKVPANPDIYLPIVFKNAS